MKCYTFLVQKETTALHHRYFGFIVQTVRLVRDDVSRQQDVVSIMV